MTAWIVIATCVAGGVGALTRYAIGRTAARWEDKTWPWATAAINISGSFLLGVVTTFPLAEPDASAIMSILGTGALGGYTTFSTASVEVMNLARSGHRVRAVVSAWGVLTCCLIGAGAGLAVGTHL